MFSLHAKVIILLLLLVSTFTCITSNNITVYLDGNIDRHSKTSQGRRNLRNLINSNILEKKVGDGVSPTEEKYNVTLTDMNGQEVRIILNRTLIHCVNTVLTARAREDAFLKTSAAENPYSVLIVGLQNDNVVGICSGSLLTRQWVLTAAHCSEVQPKPDSMLVYVGGYNVDEVLKKQMPKGSQLAKTTEFYVHPNYTQNITDGDISVVKAGPFNLTDTVNIVRLSTEPWVYQSYKECKFTGYGIVQFDVKSDDDAVRKTHVLPVKNPCVCSSELQNIFKPEEVKRYICSKPLEDYGICLGDSGSGLLCDGQVKAVAMQILLMQDSDTCDLSQPTSEFRCGSKNMLTIFIDTYPFVQWINSHVKLNNDSGSKGTKNQCYLFLSIFSFIHFLITCSY